jgi:fibronectin-binding autotransporter adhesin
MNGTGLWVLSDTNTYSGGTAIDSGTLTTTVSGALGVGPLTINAANDMTRF